MQGAGLVEVKDEQYLGVTDNTVMVTSNSRAVTKSKKSSSQINVVIASPGRTAAGPKDQKGVDASGAMTINASSAQTRSKNVSKAVTPGGANK
jgi:hypothetical protein